MPPFVKDALQAGLDKCGASLDPWLWDDFYGELVLVCLRLGAKYDRSRSSLTFSTYAGTILRRRVVDRFRDHLGDSRRRREPSKLPPRGEAAWLREDGTIDVADQRSDFTADLVERIALLG